MLSLTFPVCPTAIISKHDSREKERGEKDKIGGKSCPYHDGAIDRILDVRIAQVFGQTGACGGIDHLLTDWCPIRDIAQEKPIGG